MQWVSQPAWKNRILNVLLLESTNPANQMAWTHIYSNYLPIGEYNPVGNALWPPTNDSDIPTLTLDVFCTPISAPTQAHALIQTPLPGAPGL